jgi:hypothetical protein
LFIKKNQNIKFGPDVSGNLCGIITSFGSLSSAKVLILKQSITGSLLSSYNLEKLEEQNFDKKQSGALALSYTGAKQSIK